MHRRSPARIRHAFRRISRKRSKPQRKRFFARYTSAQRRSGPSSARRFSATSRANREGRTTIPSAPVHPVRHHDADFPGGEHVPVENFDLLDRCVSAVVAEDSPVDRIRDPSVG